MFYFLIRRLKYINHLDGFHALRSKKFPSIVQRMSAVSERDIDLMSETQLRNYATAVTRENQTLRSLKACCAIVVEFSETRPNLFSRNCRGCVSTQQRS